MYFEFGVENLQCIKGKEVELGLVFEVMISNGTELVIRKGEVNN